MALDKNLVEKDKINFKAIYSGKLRRYFSWKNFIAPFFILIGFFQSLYILKKFKAKILFSKGGFVSVPVAFAAWILRIPIVLHESDSRMGLANKIISKIAKKICVSFPNLLKNNTLFELTGNPIRKSIKNGNKEYGYKITNLTDKKPCILVWGGSQGSEEINNLIKKEFNLLKSKFQIIHITGVNKKTGIKDENYAEFEYIADDLKHIYAITDFVVSRAGANTVYELAYMKKPNILIPIQNSDQINNAKYFEERGASIVFRKNQSLYHILNSLLLNKKKYINIQENLENIFKENASKKIADIIINIIKTKS